MSIARAGGPKTGAGRAGMEVRAGRRLVVILSSVTVMALPRICAADADDILGTWNAANGTARVTIERCGEAYCGAIVWLKQPVYLPGSHDGAPREPKRDARNPDPALAARPVIGLRILEQFTHREDDDVWVGGSVYDPEDGKTYRGRLRLLDRDRLELRGYVGIPLLGRSVVWTRAQGAARPAPEAAHADVR